MPHLTRSTGLWRAKAAAALGEHAKEILRELDYDEGRIEKLARDGAIGT